MADELVFPITRDVAVDGVTYQVTLCKRSWKEAIENQSTLSNFVGQKTCHALTRCIEEIEIPYVDKKTGETKAKTHRVSFYGDGFASKEVEEDVCSAFSFQLKHDGSCGFIRFNEETDEYEPWTRYDIKQNKRKPGSWAYKGKKDLVKGWIACEPEPDLSLGTNMHWPHFRSCAEDKAAYKHNIATFEKVKDVLKLHM